MALETSNLQYYKQLISKGISATLAAVEQDLEARDLRDSSRQSAPLKLAKDAKPLDNSKLTIEQSSAVLIDWWRGNRPL
jgi:3-phosphoshikimate 1-carboxyvinyltransferase